MLKHFLFIVIISFCIKSNAQVETIPKDYKTQKINENLDGTADGEMFNNINHPLAILGGILTFGGAGLYVVGAERKDIPNYSPKSTMQFVGIGTFLAGATLFAIFSTERERDIKRKKDKTYKAEEWEVEN
jgi:hypothetical protein